MRKSDNDNENLIPCKSLSQELLLWLFKSKEDQKKAHKMFLIVRSRRLKKVRDVNNFILYVISDSLSYFVYETSVSVNLSYSIHKNIYKLSYFVRDEG